MESNGACPTVSVIVPVSGGAAELPSLLDSLQNTSYPPEQREIIVVDNGLTEEARAPLARRPVTVLHEPSAGSPGLARNRGARAAKGEILAFVDSDCVVAPEWIRQGVEALRAEGADVAAGHIIFQLSQEQQAAEIFDSLVHMRNDILIKQRGVVVTANLFVRRDAFLSTGGFPSGFGSEDFLWARSAREQGLRFVYAPDAIALHPARKLRALLDKARRVGPYAVLQFREHRIAGSRLRHQILSAVMPWPSHLHHVQRLIDERGEPWMHRKDVSIAAVSYLYGLWWSATVIRGLLRMAPARPPERHREAIAPR